MNNVIIGIGGVKGSGKDTVASMINYIANTIPQDCNYYKYNEHKDICDKCYNIYITHFADNLKKALCAIYGFNMKQLNSHKYKDDYWFSITDGKWYSDKEIDNTTMTRIENDYLDNISLAAILNHTKTNCLIKIRTLLQYFGTGICRKYLNNNIWVNSTIQNAIKINNKYRYCIIPDVRFQNEVDAIRNVNNSKGVIILVNRDTGIIDNHSSELLDFNFDYVIENNGTLPRLFKQCVNLVNIIENETNQTTSRIMGK